MLDFKRVKSHAGMKLVGDYSTLRGLHELIHKVASSSPLLREASQSEFLLGLAYDVRKAFEQQRDIIKPPRHAADVGSGTASTYCGRSIWCRFDCCAKRWGSCQPMNGTRAWPFCSNTRRWLA